MTKLRRIGFGRKRLRTAVWAAVLACGIVPGGEALARPKPGLEAPALIDDVAPDRPLQRGGGLSLQQAIQIATSRYQGRVVRADTIMRNGRPVHEIRILGDDGRVRTVQIDAQSGDLR